MHNVLMPRLTDSMQEGTILRWLKQTGDAVSRGEHIVEVETDKANTSCEADADGPLHIGVPEGTTVPVGSVIATIGGPGVEGAPPAGRSGQPADARRAARHAPASVVEAGRTLASPVARRLAREHALDLATIVGSGPNGRVVKADVLRAASQADTPQTMEQTASILEEGPASRPADTASAPGKGHSATVTLTRVERTIARRMAESRATIPDFSVSTEADMTASVALRSQIATALESSEIATTGGGAAPPPTLNDFVVKACGIALRAHPRVNSSYADGSIVIHERINVGIAVAGQRTLVVPTIFDADARTLAEIAKVTRERVSEVRSGEISPGKLANGTFTVSNLGMLGVTSFNAVINPPQAAILAVGAAVQRPVELDGRIALIPAMTLTLTCDHRVLNGADGARFLSDVRALLEEPLALLYATRDARDMRHASGASKQEGR